MAKTHLGELIFFWILFGVVGSFAFVVMSPYLAPLFLAVVFMILFRPVYAWLQTLFSGKNNLAALLTIICALVVVAIPLVYLGAMLFREVIAAYGALAGSGTASITGFDNVAFAIERQIRVFSPAFDIHATMTAYLEGILRWFATNLNSFFSGILSFFLQCFIIVVAMFFLYTDGKKVHDFAVKWSPLADNYDETLIGKLETAVSSVVKGTLVTAIVQGTLVGVGFAIFGIPNPVLWGTAATIAALIPLVGTAIISAPACVWLIITGHLGAGVGLIIWALALVGLVDNILRPYVARKGMNVHPFLILLSVLGGLVYFGPIGFIAGPIVLAFFFALLDIYPDVMKGREIKEQA